MTEKKGLAVLSSLLVLLVTVPASPSFAQGSQSSSGLPLSIDRTLFMSTVPSAAVIGVNYTVKVLVRNSLNTAVPVILWIVAPVDSVMVRPLQIHSLVQPNGQFLANFSLIAFHPTSVGHINVTAVLSVWVFQDMPRPQVIQQLSATVYSVTTAPVAAQLELAAVMVAVVVLAGVFVYLRRGRGRGAPAPVVA